MISRADGEVYSYLMWPECSDENLWTRAHTIYYASTSSQSQWPKLTVSAGVDRPPGHSPI
jgi:hypothetical protein